MFHSRGEIFQGFDLVLLCLDLEIRWKTLCRNVMPLKVFILRGLNFQGYAWFHEECDCIFAHLAPSLVHVLCHEKCLAIPLDLHIVFPPSRSGNINDVDVVNLTLNGHIL